MEFKPEPLKTIGLPILDPEANDLGDRKVVGLLVRTFVDRCLAAVSAAASGERDADLASEELHRTAEVMNGLFLGDPEIGPVKRGPWNTPEQLGAFLRETMGFEDPAEFAVRAAFVRLASILTGDVAGQEDELRARSIEQIVGEVTSLLLGELPETAPADDEVAPYA